MNAELLAIQREKLDAAGLLSSSRPRDDTNSVFDDEYGANRLRVQLLDPQLLPSPAAIPMRSPAATQPALLLLQPRHDTTPVVLPAAPPTDAMARRMTAFDEYAALEVELGRLLHAVRRRNQPVLQGQKWVVPRIAMQLAAARGGDAAKVAELEAYQAECVRVWQAAEATIEAIMANAYVRARIGADSDDRYARRNEQHHREALWARVLP